MLKPTTPTLHRTLGRAWLDVLHDKATTLPILQDGLKYEPNNPDLLNAHSTREVVTGKAFENYRSRENRAATAGSV